MFRSQVDDLLWEVLMTPPCFCHKRATDRMIINYQCHQGVKEWPISETLRGAILRRQQAISRTPGSKQCPEAVKLIAVSSPLLTLMQQGRLWGRSETSHIETARPSLLLEKEWASLESLRVNNYPRKPTKLYYISMSMPIRPSWPNLPFCIQSFNSFFYPCNVLLLCLVLGDPIWEWLVILEHRPIFWLCSLQLFV